MDEELKKKVEELAKRMKELHLASNMEEALRRASEILNSTKGQALRELSREMESEFRKDKKKEEELARVLAEDKKAVNVIRKLSHEENHDIASTKSEDMSASRLKKSVQKDARIHDLEKGAVKDALKDLNEVACAIKDTEEIIAAAKKVQKRKKE